MIATLLLAATQLIPWSISDTTNNLTGRREVSATQLAENPGERRAALALYCGDDGKVGLWLSWPTRLADQFIPVSIHIVLGPQTDSGPAIWSVSQVGTARDTATAPAGLAEALATQAPTQGAMVLTIHRSEANEDKTFVTNGFRDAYRRVAAACETTK